jgi:hypothetical protein
MCRGVPRVRPIPPSGPTVDFFEGRTQGTPLQGNQTGSFRSARILINPRRWSYMGTLNY